MNRSWIKRMGLWAFGMVLFTLGTLLAALLLLVWHRYASSAAISAWLEAAQPWFFLWRLCLFGLLIGFWPAVCRWLARSFDLTADQLIPIRNL